MARRERRKRSDEQRAVIRAVADAVSADQREKDARPVFWRSWRHRSRPALAVVGLALAVWLTGRVVALLAAPPVFVGLVGAVGLALFWWRHAVWLESPRDRRWAIGPALGALGYLLAVSFGA